METIFAWRKKSLVGSTPGIALKGPGFLGPPVFPVFSLAALSNKPGKQTNDIV